jgi:hypothetical protein
MNVTGIKINVNGNLSLIDFDLENGGTDLKPNLSIFECQYCKKKPDEKYVSTKPFVFNINDFSFDLFSHNVHEKDIDNDCPYNNLSDLFFRIACPCGHEEHDHLYKGNFYIAKFDRRAWKDQPADVSEEAFNKIFDEKTTEELLEKNKPQNCTERDLIDIQNSIDKRQENYRNRNKSGTGCIVL